MVASTTLTADRNRSVVLDSFMSVYLNGHPVLFWITQSESNNLGWNIYRSETDILEEAFQINTGLIPGAGTTTESTEYIYEDEYEIEYGETYWYWLEAIDLTGATDIIGSITLTTPVSEFIELSLFEVLSPVRFLDIIWITEWENGCAGFNLWRATSDYLPDAVQINPYFITGQDTCTTPTEYFYYDEISIHGEYWYWLETISINSDSCFYGSAYGIFAGIYNQEIPFVKKGIYLSDNFPNPFKLSKADRSTGTKISFSISEDSFVDLTIYNIKGQIIKTLINEYKIKGTFATFWDGKDESGKPVSSGIYLYRLKSNNDICTKKMMLLH